MYVLFILLHVVGTIGTAAALKMGVGPRWSKPKNYSLNHARKKRAHHSFSYIFLNWTMCSDGYSESTHIF